jgi:hypothetical protein
LKGVFDMINVNIEMRANGTIAVIDGFSKAKTTKGILKDLNKELVKLGYNELANIMNDKCSLQDMAAYAESKESNPFASQDNHYTFDIEKVEEGKTYISHSFIM